MSREAQDFVAKYAPASGIKGANLQILWIMAYKTKDRRPPYRTQISAAEIALIMSCTLRYVQMAIAAMIAEGKLNIGHPGVGRAPTSYWFGHEKKRVDTNNGSQQATKPASYQREPSTGSA